MIEKEKELLNQFDLINHLGDETWGEIEGSWNNIGSMWNNSDEIPHAKKIRELLSGVNKSDIRDRGILLDTIMEGCDVLLTENTSETS